MLPDQVRRVLRLRLARDWERAEIDDELRFHIEQRTARLIAAGRSPEDAQAEAERLFGSIEPVREECAAITRSHYQSRRRMDLRDALKQDVTNAGRAVARRPGLSAAVIVVLAIGLSATAATLSTVDRLMLRLPAGVHDGEDVSRLYLMQRNSAGGEDASPLLASELRLLREGVPEFEEVGAFGSMLMETGLGATAEQIRVAAATPDFFTMLGSRAAVGRLIAESDDVRPDGTPVVVLSHGYWQRRFGGDVGAIGQTIDLDRTAYTIIGVAEPGFQGLELEGAAAWIPYAAMGARLGGAGWETSQMGASWVWPVVRLRDGADPAAAADRALAAYFTREGWGDGGDFRSRNRMALLGLTPASNPAMSADVRVALLLTGVAVLVLLIACTNAASLLLLRAAARQREHAVRSALGASRMRIAHLLVAESTLLAVLAALVTIPVVWRGRDLLQGLVLPQLAEPPGVPEPRLIAGVFLLALTVGLVTAVAPIARLGGAGLSGTLRDTRAAARSGVQRALLAVQCAVSLVLLVGAGAFATSLRNVERLDLGLARHELVAASLNMSGLGRSRADLDDLYAGILERLQATPGIRGATLATNLPLRLTHSAGRVYTEDADSVNGPIYFYGVQGSYFHVTGTPILLGRGLEADDDRAGALPVTVINETLADRLWPGTSPVGRCIHPGAREAECLTVVGVARDVHRRRVQEDPGYQYYAPAQHLPGAARQILVRTAGPAELHVENVRQAILSVESGLPFVRVAPLSSELEREMRPWRLGTGSFSVFAVLAAVLAAIGLYGAVSYALRQRAREIGVRVALGARSASLIRLVLGDALKTGVIGCAIGIVVAVLLAPWIEPLLYDSDPRSPLLLGFAALAVLTVSALAVLAPAIRATRVDPAVALRAD